MYYGWDEEHTSLVRASVKEFCDKELSPEYVRWMDENCDFPPDNLWKKLVDYGVFLRGAGGGPYDYLIIQEEIATASVAVMLAVGASVSFGQGFIIMLGNIQQKKQYLPGLASGDLKMCMALTEPGGGTDILGSLRTTAELEGDEWVLNGQKVFITAAHVADYLIVIAITDKKAEDRTQAWSTFIVGAKSPGVTIRKIPKLGIHACSCCEIFLDDVKVPKENLLGPMNKAYRFLVAGDAGGSSVSGKLPGGKGKGANVAGGGALMALLNSERVSTAILSLGIANAAYRDAFKYALEREAFGRPIGQFQVIQGYLVEMAMQIEHARHLIYSTVALGLIGKPANVQAQMAKVAAARASEYCAIKGMEILGGWGYSMEYDMQRHFRDYKQMVFAPITDEMAINVIARMLGMPKSY